MKRLTARKCKDGWLIAVEETFIFRQKNFVKHHIKTLGLTITFEDDKKIVAEEKI